MNNQIETRAIELREFADSGPGSFQVYASVFYVLDDYQSMFLPGAFQKGLSNFLQRGFTANSHDWGYDGVIGYPTSAVEDSYGLLCTSEFHSTADAQLVRTKAMERQAAGKKVFASVGFLAVRDMWVEQSSYADVLPQFIPAEKLSAVMAQVASKESIRLILEGELWEYSIVTAPSNMAAEVIEVRSTNPDDGAHGVRYSEELSTALAAVKAVEAAVLRGRDIHAKRHEQRVGRTVSAKNRTALTEMHSSMLEACTAMQGHCETLKSFLDETDPAKSDTLSSDARNAQASLILTQLGLMRMGVPKLTGAILQ